MDIDVEVVEAGDVGGAVGEDDVDAISGLGCFGRSVWVESLEEQRDGGWMGDICFEGGNGRLRGVVELESAGLNPFMTIACGDCGVLGPLFA